jgi:hypothetical protein
MDGGGFRSCIGFERKRGWEGERSSDGNLLAVTVWGALEDSEMTGQQVRLWRSLMLGWGERLDG